MMKRLPSRVSLVCLLFLAGCSKPVGVEVEGEVIGEDGLKSYTFQTSGGAIIEAVSVEFIELDKNDKETTNRYHAELQELGNFKFSEKLPARNYGVVVNSNIQGKTTEKMSSGRAKVAVSPTSRHFLINLATQKVSVPK